MVPAPELLIFLLPFGTKLLVFLKRNVIFLRARCIILFIGASSKPIYLNIFIFGTLPNIVKSNLFMEKLKREFINNYVYLKLGDSR